MRNFSTGILFFLPFILLAEIRSETGQWKANGSAKEVFDTALGTLFHLPPNEGNGAYAGFSPAHENYDSCDCPVCKNGRVRVTSLLSLKIPNKIKITTKTRYIALDFRIRVFPALEKVPKDPKGEKKVVSHLYFSLLDSETPIFNSRQFDLHGRKIIDEGKQDDSYDSGRAPLIVGRKSHERNFIHPAFEPLSIRVVYDLMGKEMTYFMNGRGFEYPVRIHGKRSALRLRYFGIATYQSKGSSKSSKKKRRKNKDEGEPFRSYFEVSPPKIYVYDDVDGPPPPPVFSPYPYGRLLLDRLSKGGPPEKVTSRADQEEFRRVLKHKNPDLQYAYALRYLYGKGDADPEKGLELLKHAVKKPNFHALAFYQLGICFWRGYGCRPSPANAAEYLKKAIQLDYPEAVAALFQLKMEQRGRPWFCAEPYQLKGAFGHDHAFFTDTYEFMSPKRLWASFYTARILRRIEDPDLSYSYMDYRLKANDPFSFLPHALSLESLPQQESYLFRAVKSRHFEAYPFWLMCRLHQDKLPEAKEIPLEMCVLHAGNPVFNLAYALACLPEAERMKYLKRSGGELQFRPTEQWALKTPESGYLRAMRMCMVEAYSPNLYLFKRSVDLLSESYGNDPGRQVFDLIRASADAKYAPALYLMGKFYYYDDFPDPSMGGLSNRLFEAEQFLTAAMQQGYVPAALLLCRVKLDSAFQKYEEILPLLEKLCASKIPEAFYLKAEVLEKMHRLPEALAAAEKAVELGEHRGLLFLARHEKGANVSGGKQKRMLQYIQADRDKRRMDPYDPYWNEPYGEYLRWVYPPKDRKTGKAEPLSAPSVDDDQSAPEETGKKSGGKKSSTKRKTIRFRGDDDQSAPEETGKKSSTKRKTIRFRSE